MGGVTHNMARLPEEPSGLIAGFMVELVYDRDDEGRRYDLVDVSVVCTRCGATIPASRSYTAAIPVGEIHRHTAGCRSVFQRRA
jgi:hypothetical protein